MRRNVSVILLTNEEGKFLVQHRAKDAKRKPNVWGFFGGGIEEHETPLEAVIRETQEELCYTLENPTLILEQKLGDATKYIFTEKYDSTKSLNQLEGQDMAWLSIDEFLEKETIDHDRDAIQLLIGKNN